MDDVSKNLKSLERKVKRLEKENMALRFKVEQVEMLWRNSNTTIYNLMNEMDEWVDRATELQEKIDEY